MNSVNIIGNISSDIELRYSQSGTAFAKFSIAVDQSYKNKDTGQKVEKVSFFDIAVAGKRSEVINQYFSKGKKIGITGELEQQTWKDQKSGQNRSKVVIKLNDFTFLEKKESNGQANNQGYDYNQQQNTAPQSNNGEENKHVGDTQRGEPVYQPAGQGGLPNTLDDSEIPF